MSAQDKEPKFETASATTDPDNSNSGPFAYIVTAICLGGTLMLGVLGAGCTSVILSATASSHSANAGTSGATSPFDLNDNGATPNGNEDTGLNDLDDIFDFYNRELNDLYGNGDSTTGNDAQGRSTGNDASGSAKTTDALDYQLAPYGDEVDDCVSANAYAGTPSEVRDFVRDVVAKDKDYTKQLVGLLYEAARNEDGRGEALTKAVKVCEDASKAFTDLKLPTIEKDKDGAVGDLLGSAKGKVVERWDQMKTEVQMLNTDGDIDTKQLWRTDEDIVDATEDAGELFEDAMDRAANL